MKFQQINVAKKSCCIINQLCYHKILLLYKDYKLTCNYEAALLYFETGEEEKGMEYLERAVEIWKDADSDYEKASIAKEKLSSLK